MSEHQNTQAKALTKHEQRLDSLGEYLTELERHDGIKNYLSGLGDPTRDSGASGRPSMATRLLPHELEILYIQNDLAGTIVDELVDEALRQGIAIGADDDSPDDPMKGWTDDLNVVEKVGDSAKWGRLYGAGFTLIVLDDGLDPSAPVDLDRIHDVVQLVDLDRYEVAPVRWQTDIFKPGFGEPDMYDVQPSHEGGSTQGLGDGRVHASRLLKFGGTKLPRTMRSANQGYDDSVLQRPWDAIRRFCETEQGMARIVQSFQTTAISISGLADIMQDDEGAELIRERMKMLAEGISLINAILLDADAGEQIMRESASVAGLPDLRAGFAESVAKAARYPMTILFGQAPGGLNTDGDSGIQGWHKRVHAFQVHRLGRELRKLYTYVFRAKNGPTDGKEPEKWHIEWPALDEPGEKERAEIRKSVAETDALYLDRGVRSPEQVARSRDGHAGWSHETIPLEAMYDDELDL